MKHLLILVNQYDYTHVVGLTQVRTGKYWVTLNRDTTKTHISDLWEYNNKTNGLTQIHRITQGNLWLRLTVHEWVDLINDRGIGKKVKTWKSKKLNPDFM